MKTIMLVLVAIVAALEAFLYIKVRKTIKDAGNEYVEDISKYITKMMIIMAAIPIALGVVGIVLAAILK